MPDSLLQFLQDSALATAIREGDLWFPWIECLHVLALTWVVGSIGLVDLRLMGLAARSKSVSETTATVLPITWTAFAAAVITGGLLFSSNASTYAQNVYFQRKVCLILLAGLNMAIYHLWTGRHAGDWMTADATPWRARIVGGLSLGLWIAITACGRWIGFTLNAPPS